MLVRHRPCAVDQRSVRRPVQPHPSVAEASDAILFEIASSGQESGPRDPSLHAIAARRSALLLAVETDAAFGIVVAIPGTADAHRIRTRWRVRRRAGSV